MHLEGQPLLPGPAGVVTSVGCFDVGGFQVQRIFPNGSVLAVQGIYVPSESNLFAAVSARDGTVNLVTTGNTTVYLQRISPSGVASSRVTVAADQKLDPSVPSTSRGIVGGADAAVNGDGEGVIVWNVPTGDSDSPYELRGVRLASNGTFGPVVSLGTAGLIPSPRSPGLAVTPDGSAYIAVRSTYACAPGLNDGTCGARLIRWPASGSPSKVGLLTEIHNSNVSVIAHENNTVTISALLEEHAGIWPDRIPARIQTQLYDGSLGPPQVMSELPPRSDFPYEINGVAPRYDNNYFASAEDAAGRTVVTWSVVSRINPDGECDVGTWSADVFARTVSPSGALIGSGATALSSKSGGGEGGCGLPWPRPKVAIDKYDTASVLWDDSNSDLLTPSKRWIYKLDVARFKTATPDQFQVSNLASISTGRQEMRGIAAGGDGATTAIWDGTPDIGPGARAFSRFDPAAETPASQTSTAPITPPSPPFRPTGTVKAITTNGKKVSIVGAAWAELLEGFASARPCQGSVEDANSPWHALGSAYLCVFSGKIFYQSGSSDQAKSLCILNVGLSVLPTSKILTVGKLAKSNSKFASALKAASKALGELKLTNKSDRKLLAALDYKDVAGNLAKKKFLDAFNSVLVSRQVALQLEKRLGSKGTKVAVKRLKSVQSAAGAILATITGIEDVTACRKAFKV